MLRIAFIAALSKSSIIDLGFSVTLNYFMEENISRYVISFFCLAMQKINGMVTDSLTNASIVYSWYPIGAESKV